MTGAPPGTAAGPGAVAALATALVCAGCGHRVPDDAPLAFACPAAAPGDDIDHVLVRVIDPAAGPLDEDPAALNPFVRWRTRFHAYHRARAIGWSDAEYRRFVDRLDAQVGLVDDHGFRVTPFARSGPLSDALGLSAGGGVWVKDETGNVSGSHKARHLFGTLLELGVEEARRRAAGADPDAAQAPLAIASCGNAALAAAVVAGAAKRHLDVFIPTDADPVVVERLAVAWCRAHRLRARAGGPRRPDLPCAACARSRPGAVPFTCQGNLNGLAIEGGETLGWELAAAVGAPDGPARLDRVVVQVGGGALLSSVIGGLRYGDVPLPRIHAVQPATVHPLARAFERVRARVAAGEDPHLLADAAQPPVGLHVAVGAGAAQRRPRHHRRRDLRLAGLRRAACSPAVAARSWRPRRRWKRPTLSPAPPPGSTSIPPARPGWPACSTCVRTRAVGPDETVAVLFTGAVRRPPTPAPGDHPVTRAAHRRLHSHHATSGGI